MIKINLWYRVVYTAIFYVLVYKLYLSMHIFMKYFKCYEIFLAYTLFRMQGGFWVALAFGVRLNARFNAFSKVQLLN